MTEHPRAWKAREAQYLAGHARMLHEARRHIHPDDYAAGPGRKTLIHALNMGYSSEANPDAELAVLQSYVQAIADQAGEPRCPLT